MKKSGKIKGKERDAAKKKKYMQYGIIAAVCIAAAIVLSIIVAGPAGAKAGDTVSVLYIGTLDNGTVFDTNVNSTPLVFTIGAHTVIPGFEEAVAGMDKGQVKTIHIPVDKAYGPYRSDLVRVVNRSKFPPDAKPEVGQLYTLRNTTDGTTSIAKVINVTGDSVTIDENHMLAGQNLTFMIRLIGITQGK
jgi:peptidylprolyl isomerase